jgi:hypothetical protein
MTVEPFYRGYRIEVHAALVDGAWDATVRIRRVLTPTGAKSSDQIRSPRLAS